MSPSLDDVLVLKDRIRTNQVAQDAWDDCMSRFMGINRTDARCLDIIDRHDRVTAGQLASESGLTTGAVTVAVDRLEAVGYVQRMRDPADRRRVWIAKTEIANEIGARLFAHFQHMTPVLLSRYTADQIAAIIEFLAVSARINLEQAGVLEQHTEAGNQTLDERLAAAARFQQASAARIEAMIRALEAGELILAPEAGS